MNCSVEFIPPRSISTETYLSIGRGVPVAFVENDPPCIGIEVLVDHAGVVVAGAGLEDKDVDAKLPEVVNFGPLVGEGVVD